MKYFDIFYISRLRQLWALTSLTLPCGRYKTTHNIVHTLQNTEYRTQNLGHRIQNTEPRTQNPEHRTQNTERRTQNTEHRTQSPELGNSCTLNYQCVCFYMAFKILLQASPILGPTTPSNGPCNGSK
jgi:hypothetical protein